MFRVIKEFLLLKPFIQEGNFFRVVRIIIVGNTGFVKLLGYNFVPKIMNISVNLVNVPINMKYYQTKISYILSLNNIVII